MTSALLEALQGSSMFQLGSAPGMSRLIDNTVAPDSNEIHRMLASASVRDRIAGLRAVLALMASGNDGIQFAPDVVRCSQSSDSKIRDMVGTYLTAYSEREPELALMVVNTLQRGLGEPLAIARASSLRYLSSLLIPAVAPIVLHSCQTMAGDPSPEVRIAVCKAIRKCHDLDPSLSGDLLNVLTRFIGDRREPRVVGAALTTLFYSFPSRLELLHPVFRSICETLPKFDDWSKIDAVRLLVRYCRHYMTSSDDPDLNGYLFPGIEPLLSSLNDALVIEAAAAYHYLGNDDSWERYQVAEHVTQLPYTTLTLPAILALAQAHPSSFEPFSASFLVLDLDEPEQTRVLKLKVFATVSSRLQTRGFQELQFLSGAFQGSPDTVRAVMEAMAVIGSKEPKGARRAVRWLVDVVGAPNQSSALVGEALLALRILLMQQNSSELGINRDYMFSRLSHYVLSTDIAADARATVVWLIGEHALKNPALSAELLRRLLRDFAEQPVPVRLQTYQLAAKLAAATDRSLGNETETGYSGPYEGFIHFALELGRYDSDYDARDRARLLAGLLEQRDLSLLMLQSVKPPPENTLPAHFMVGTASLVLGHRLDGYADLEPWARVGDPSLREEVPMVQNDTSVIGSTESSYVSSSRTSRVPTPVSVVRQAQKMSLEEFLSSESGSKVKTDAQSQESDSQTPSIERNSESPEISNEVTGSEESESESESEPEESADVSDEHPASKSDSE